MAGRSLWQSARQTLGRPKSFPDITHEPAPITKGMRSPAAERHIAGLLGARRGGFDAVYLVAAYNAPFIRALEESSSGRRTSAANSFRAMRVWPRC